MLRLLGTRFEEFNKKNSHFVLTKCVPYDIIYLSLREGEKTLWTCFIVCGGRLPTTPIAHPNNFLRAVRKDIMKTSSTPSPPRPKRYRSFWFVIYPNEDKNHKKMLDYLLHKERFQVFYIEHNRCKVTANSKLVKEGKAKVGDPIKPHTHVFVKLKNSREQMSAETFGKWFDGWINPNEPKGASSADACAEYFLHENPKSINEGKVLYKFNELKGDEEFIGKLIIGQNAHFVQWQVILPMLKSGSTIADIMEKCFNMDNDTESRRFMDFILSNQYLLLGISNQEINKLKSIGGRNS